MFRPIMFPYSFAEIRVIKLRPQSLAPQHPHLVSSETTEAGGQ